MGWKKNRVPPLLIHFGTCLPVSVFLTCIEYEIFVYSTTTTHGNDWGSIPATVTRFQIPIFKADRHCHQSSTSKIGVVTHTIHSNFDLKLFIKKLEERKRNGSLSHFLFPKNKIRHLYPRLLNIHTLARCILFAELKKMTQLKNKLQ